jgi:hypothetical protein
MSGSELDSDLMGSVNPDPERQTGPTKRKEVKKFFLSVVLDILFWGAGCFALSFLVVGKLFMKALE